VVGRQRGGLIFFLALILYFQHRYRLTAEDVPNPGFRFDIASMPLTPSQRATAKYFVIALALFLVQCLLGGKMAHDYAEGATFFGFNIAQYLPFNIARTWHLQLAIFWIATAWLGMGIFIAPLVSGTEIQRGLVNILFGALVLVVVAAWRRVLSVKDARRIVVVAGHAGLGVHGAGAAVDVLLLISGMGIWLFIVARGLRAALRRIGPRRSYAPAALRLDGDSDLLLLRAVREPR
jgi:nitric oxide reductase subunit B